MSQDIPDGLTGVFADRIGTLTASGSADVSGTDVIEFQPAAPSPPSSEPTETMRIVVSNTAVPGSEWPVPEGQFGRGFTHSGDVVGSVATFGNSPRPAYPTENGDHRRRPLLVSRPAR